jgi:Zn-dependent peptidase ImmA (M78 family)/DNA-binding XRE family transcriptional regulator
MADNTLDRIDPQELGLELKRARVKRGLRQADAAKIINVARTTITAIEKGERRIKPEELITLARAYGHQVSDFVRERPKVEPFQVQFRGPFLRSEEDEKEIRKFVDSLEELARDYLELEQITHTPLVQNYPPEYQTAGIEVVQAAEEIAIRERNRLGLGEGPIPILRDVLEQDVGLRVFYLELNPSKYSAIYLYNHDLGGCIAVNRLHPEERRRWSLAHDYGHFLAHRYKPTVFVENNYQRLPESERFADYFASFFLMPTGGLTMRFNDLRRSKEKVTVADLCTLAHYYGVSVAAFTIRLEDIKLLPSGTWDRLQQGGFKVREAQRELGLPPIPMRDDMLPIRYQYLAVTAFEEGLISEGRLAHFLRVDRLEARRISDLLRGHTSGITDARIIELDLAEHVDI